MTDTATDPKVATLVTSLETQVNNAITVLTEAGVDLKHGIAVPGEQNWRLGPDGLMFGDTRTDYTAEEYADVLVDPINLLRRIISMVSHMTHPSFVGKLLA